jgi:Rrf2 family transcriptional regulator, cysteine metabolism repressor
VSGVSQKGQYALRAVFELAKRRGDGPASVADIAARQAIPPRFLELIIQQMKQAGYVESRRGTNGGYLLAMPANQIAVAQIIRLIDGNLSPVRCVVGRNEEECPMRGRCAFMGMWMRAKHALEHVYETTTLQDLVDEEDRIVNGQMEDYSI